jgi:hypothetical protein
LWCCGTANSSAPPSNRESSRTNPQTAFSAGYRDGGGTAPDKLHSILCDPFKRYNDMPVGNPLGSGGLFTPSAMSFGPDGNLCISGGTFGGNLDVRRYNPTTGAFIDFFANTGSDLLSPVGITFGPDNTLYVSTQNAANVMGFNYPAGTFMDFFVPNGGGGLTAPFHLTFGAGPSILTYTLQRDCLTNVNDPGMLWQIEGGKVLQNGKHVANYSSVKRTSRGTTELNTAQLWVTLFFLGGNPAREHYTAWCP